MNNYRLLPPSQHLTVTEMAAELSKALGQEVRYNAVTPEAYRGFGFPGADDLGNMFQFYRDFEKDFCASRNLKQPPNSGKEGSKLRHVRPVRRAQIAGLVFRPDPRKGCRAHRPMGTTVSTPTRTARSILQASAPTGMNSCSPMPSEAGRRPDILFKWAQTR